jgi:hypothetical protein
MPRVRTCSMNACSLEPAKHAPCVNCSNTTTPRLHQSEAALTVPTMASGAEYRFGSMRGATSKSNSESLAKPNPITATSSGVMDRMTTFCGRMSRWRKPASASAASVRPIRSTRDRVL